jgi:hypothetical protein
MCTSPVSEHIRHQFYRNNLNISNTEMDRRHLYCWSILTNQTYRSLKRLEWAVQELIESELGS